MKKLFVLASSAMMLTSAAFAQNLLVNGDFSQNDPINAGGALGWNHWNVGDGWSHTQVLGSAELDPKAGTHGGHDCKGNYDGSQLVVIGGLFQYNYSGVYQEIAVNAGSNYQFEFDAGAEAWWLPWGECNMVFYDATHTEINRTTIRPTDSLNNAVNGGLGNFYDTGVPMQHFKTSSVAPANTTTMRAEIVFYGNGDSIGTWGGGNLWFDNASVTLVPSLTGQIILNNYAATLAGQQVLIELRNPGTTNVVESQTVTLDVKGNYSLNTAKVGTFDITAKGSHWLKGLKSNVTLGSSGSSGNDFTLVNGDIDGNNTVNINDYGILSDSFNKVVGDTGFAPGADLDGNGAVNINDYGILSDNFNKVGV